MLKINHPDYTEIQKEIVKLAVKTKEEVASLHKKYKSDKAISVFALLAVTACVGILIMDAVIDFMIGTLFLCVLITMLALIVLFAAKGEPWLFPLDSEYRNITVALDKIIGSKDFSEAAAILDAA